MARVTRDLLTRVGTVTQAWEKLSPKKKFSGFTVAQMKEMAHRCQAVRVEIKAQENNLKGALKRRSLLDTELAEMERRVVLAVRSDDEFGEDSSLFGEMGFVPRSQRARRARRRSNGGAASVGGARPPAAAPAVIPVAAPTRTPTS